MKKAYALILLTSISANLYCQLTRKNFENAVHQESEQRYHDNPRIFPQAVIADSASSEHAMWFLEGETFSLLDTSNTSGHINRIIYVPEDYGKIQEAIDAAINGDTVLVAEGTYLENINFRGKAITVASGFILDKDTAHISKTVIDGSGYSDWKDASTVLMKSREDTTSVLTGFTITGGAGSLITRGYFTDYYGAGIGIMNSGGKITNNIIEGNHMTPKDSVEWYFGGGIHASTNRGRTAIIRNNIIRNNTVTGDRTYGGGILIDGGRIIVENNLITENSLDALVKNSYGAGLFWFNNGDPGAIEEIIIRNNYIDKNTGSSFEGMGGGGGIGAGKNITGEILIYNNVICNNSVDGFGGGVFNWSIQLWICQNTIYNNAATQGGSSLYINNAKVVMNNNIIGSDTISGSSDILFWEYASESLVAYFNLLKEPFGSGDPVRSGCNTFLKPVFKPGTYKLAKDSPAIGRGCGYLMVNQACYTSPVNDIEANRRPNIVDIYGDAGAYESEYVQVLTSSANLLGLLLEGNEVQEQLHPDTLVYTMRIPKNTEKVEDLQAIPQDGLAKVEYKHASNFPDGNDGERTTEITVTSSDGSRQKIYKVRLDSMSENANLSELSVDCGTLNPEFDPSVLNYETCIPMDFSGDPLITAVPASEFASILIIKPSGSYGIASIVVFPEYGDYNVYRINFNIIPGTEDNAGLARLKVYPNPVNDYLTIEMGQHGHYSVEITSLSGKLIHSSILEGSSMQIDMTPIGKGIYIVRIRSEEKLKIQKVIKL